MRAVPDFIVRSNIVKLVYCLVVYTITNSSHIPTIIQDFVQI